MILSIITIAWWAFIYVRAFLDNNLIKAKIPVNHKVNAIVAIFVASVFSFVGNGFSVSLITFVFYLLSLYWIGFDLVLNRMRGKEILYLGTTAFLDRIFKSIYLQLTVKLICLGISIWVYLYFKK